jgi:hypothetical protein
LGEKEGEEGDDEKGEVEVAVLGSESKFEAEEDVEVEVGAGWCEAKEARVIAWDPDALGETSSEGEEGPGVEVATGRKVVEEESSDGDSACCWILSFCS